MTIKKPTVKIQMVDLKAQYQEIKETVQQNINDVLDSGAYINGPYVKNFCNDLSAFLNTKYVIPCANGTDALQLALMALNLPKGSEVITTAFTFVATIEVIVLLGLKPVFVDIDLKTFNIDADKIEAALTKHTKVILPVHLYGQSAKMEAINSIAKKHNLYVVEDNAQAIGATYQGTITGNFGDISCISFYPSKNLGAYGDAGVVCTNNAAFAENLNCLANHGQTKKYHYGKIGVNSRLDSIQAAILQAKLPHLCAYSKSRNDAAQKYTALLEDIDSIETPFVQDQSFHVFHQYTIKVKNGKRDALKQHLSDHEIPSMIYYPKCLHLQEAYQKFTTSSLPKAEEASALVLSLPMHPNLLDDQIDYICAVIRSFFS